MLEHTHANRTTAVADLFSGPAKLPGQKTPPRTNLRAIFGAHFRSNSSSSAGGDAKRHKHTSSSNSNSGSSTTAATSSHGNTTATAAATAASATGAVAVPGDSEVTRHLRYVGNR
jgi:hypothetical protein